jgi:hypothetical protein
MAKNEVSEGHAIADAKAAELSELGWEQLDAYGQRIEQVKSPSGRIFRVKSHAFWDMDAWESDLLVIVRVYPRASWRRFWPYKAVRGLVGEHLPARPSP